MLMLVSTDTEPRFDRLRVVHAHLVAAIAHLNNEAQARVPVRANEHSRAVDDLQLIVEALADIVDAVHAIETLRPSTAGTVVIHGSSSPGYRFSSEAVERFRPFAWRLRSRRARRQTC